MTDEGDVFLFQQGVLIERENNVETLEVRGNQASQVRRIPIAML
jgi:hypothetical protein